jgi:SAM-dependent methyltransferase
VITLPLSYSPPDVLRGAQWCEIEGFYPRDAIRQVERASIYEFMRKYNSYLRGRVLDFGAGHQPYKSLVQGEYCPVDQGDPWPSGRFDAVMCNQVIQYLDEPIERLKWSVMAMLRGDGHLVMTYPTNWDEVESTDYWRFTKSGMEKMLVGVGLTVIHHELRAEVAIGGFKFPLGYGVVAKK